jgi:hypothetical protein
MSANGSKDQTALLLRDIIRVVEQREEIGDNSLDDLSEPGQDVRAESESLTVKRESTTERARYPLTND